MRWGPVFAARLGPAPRQAESLRVAQAISLHYHRRPKPPGSCHARAKHVSLPLASLARPRPRRCDARSSHDRTSLDPGRHQASARHGHARRRVSGLRRGVHRCSAGGRSGARHRGRQHQGQHGERADAGGQAPRHRAGAGRGGARGAERRRPAAGRPEDRHRHVLDARHVRGARRQSLSHASPTSWASRWPSAPPGRAS